MGLTDWSLLKERDLRACVRDLVALSVVPTWWIGCSSGAIAESARDLLIGMLRAETAYVRVLSPGSSQPLIAVSGATKAEIEAALDTDRESTDGHLERDGHPVNFASFPIGLGGDLGHLAVGASRPDFPTDVDSLLVRVAANQVAVAVRHTALLARHEEAQQLLASRAAQQEAVARIGLRALTGTAVEQVLSEAVAAVTETLQADCCEVLELASHSASLLLTAGTGWPAGLVGTVQVCAGVESQAGYTLKRAEPVVVEDVTGETRFARSPHLRDQGMVSGVTVIIQAGQHPYGVLGVHTRRPRVFTADDVHFLQAMAYVLGVMLDRHAVEAEREELLLQTRRAVAARDRAVGIVSHDLGNPLSTISICANALLDREPPPINGIRHMAAIVQRSAAWMQQILQDLLDRTSLDSGQLVLDRKPTAVSEVIGAAQVMFAPVADEQDVTFMVDAASDLPRIDADGRRLLQVLCNLLGNAMKFTPAGGHVVLSAKRTAAEQSEGKKAGSSASGVCFRVTDTGPGIAAADLDRVFDWFWHSDQPGHSGSGLGLSIAGGLVEAHGSQLRVESTQGVGSTFWFTVPECPELQNG